MYSNYTLLSRERNAAFIRRQTQPYRDYLPCIENKEPDTEQAEGGEKQDGFENKNNLLGAI